MTRITINPPSPVEIAIQHARPTELRDYRVIRLVVESGVDPVKAGQRFRAWKAAEFAARGYC